MNLVHTHVLTAPVAAGFEVAIDMASSLCMSNKTALSVECS